MLRIIEYFVAKAYFYYVTCVHNGYSVRNLCDHAKVVRDIYYRQAVFFLQLLKQLYYLRLYGNVKRGSGFIANKNVGVAGYCRGYYGALAHSAGKFVRILLIAPFGFGYSNVRKYFYCSFARCAAMQVLMQLQRFLNLLADGFERVKAGHGVLKHHGNLLAPYFKPIFFAAELGKIHAVIKYFALCDLAVFIQHSHEGFCKHGFAGAGFANYCKAFTFIDVERYAAYGGEHLSPKVELHLKIFYGKYFFAVIY